MDDIPFWEHEHALDEIGRLRDQVKTLQQENQNLRQALTEERQRVAILDNHANPNYFIHYSGFQFGEGQ
jgi:hypothetical protein